MENFKYFILGMVLGFVTFFAICMPALFIGNQSSQTIVTWAFFMAPMFGISYTASKGYFGKLSLIIFIFLFGMSMLFALINGGSLIASGVGYNFTTILSHAVIASTGILFLYWYICIGMGECSFLQIYVIPVGIIAVVIGLFSLLALIGIGLSYALSIIVAVIAVIVMIVLRVKNGSALD